MKKKTTKKKPSGTSANENFRKEFNSALPKSKSKDVKITKKQVEKKSK